MQTITMKTLASLGQGSEEAFEFALSQGLVDYDNLDSQIKSTFVEDWIRKGLLDPSERDLALEKIVPSILTWSPSTLETVKMLETGKKSSFKGNGLSLNKFLIPVGIGIAAIAGFLAFGGKK